MNRRLLDYLRNARFSFARGFAHPPPVHCVSHAHAYHEIVYHDKGRGVTTDTQGGMARFRAKDFVFHPARVAHEQILEKPGNDVCVQFKVTPELPAELARMVHIPAIDDPVVAMEALSLCRMPYGLPRARRLECDRRLAALFLRLLEESGLLRERKKEPAADRYAAAAREYVQQNAATMASIEDVAPAVGISYDHLRHVFKRRYNMSIKRWHLEVRVERAKELLANTNLPAKQIASLCGFATERYFSTNFKKLAGVTPGTYRASSPPR